MSLCSSQSVSTSFAYSEILHFNKSLIFSAILSLTAWAPICIPRPNSALSSNNEFAHAGPWPSAFLVYALDGADAAHIDEHPVAFAIIILSPNNWVTSFAYGVSPQPAHAPLYSRRGCSNWLPFTVFLSIGFLFSTFSTA